MRLSKKEFKDWCQENKVSKQTQLLIEKIRNTEPSRRTESSSFSVSGRFPSKKMGVVIQSESHRVELPFIHELEHDPNVLEFYDQPFPIKLNYRNSNPDSKKKNIGVMHTADFFVIYKDGAGWVECKTEMDLVKLSAKNSYRYCLDENDDWICPPGEKYAEEIDLNYWVFSDKKINWFTQRNIEFLDDYYRSDTLQVSKKVQKAVLDIVKNNQSISLEQLYKEIESERTDEGNSSVSITRDDIHWMITFGEVYVDLKKSLLTEPKRVRVYENQTAAEAYSNIHRLSLENNNYDDSLKKANVVNLIPNEEIVWDGNGLKILNVGEKEISLVDKSNEIVLIQRKVFEKLVINGEVKGVEIIGKEEISKEAKQILLKASKESLDKANSRLPLVIAKINQEVTEELLENSGVSDRTIRRWVRNYKTADSVLGIGYLGLIPKENCGNITGQIDETAKEFLEEFILEKYETIKQKNRMAVYGEYKNASEEKFGKSHGKKDIFTVTYKTFCEYVKKRSEYEQTLKRKGRRAAYKHEAFYWQLKMTTPRHGERPFHIAHIDHTELDVEIVDSITGKNLGRPWLTIMTDAYSRRVLAVYLTFDPPSYRSCMMVIRECVRRHGRLPQILVLDGGKEFSSTYFETLLGVFEITKKTRPPAKSRFGTLVERMFGTANTRFINNLQGNTQITKNVRQVTKSVNPKNHAIWTLTALYKWLCEFFYEVYDETEHSTLLQSPKDAFAIGLQRTGKREHRLISYDKDFRLLTLPTTPKGTAKVNGNSGVKINRINYWTDEFRHPEIIGQQVPIRYDPFNVGIAYAYVDNSWRKCFSDYFSILENKTEKELQIATNILKKKQKDSGKTVAVTASKLARFIERLEDEEQVLIQRIKDTEARPIFSVINGEQISQIEDSYPQEDHVEMSDNDDENSVEVQTEEEDESFDEYETWENTAS